MPEESYLAIKEAMEYIRTTASLTSRSQAFPASTATARQRVAILVKDEVDCLTTFEAKLEAGGILTRKKMDEIREAYNQQMLEISQQVKQEASPRSFDNLRSHLSRTERQVLVMATMAQAIRMALHYGEKTFGHHRYFRRRRRSAAWRRVHRHPRSVDFLELSSR